MEITANKTHLIVKVPLMVKRSNPWDDNYHPAMDNIIGVIAGDEIGFAYWIDMDYKGKDDQISEPFLIYNGEKKEFKKLCKKLGINIHEYAVCAYCYKVIYGVYTIGNKGNMCFDCKEN